MRSAPPGNRRGMPYSREIEANTPIAVMMLSGLPMAMPQTICGRSTDQVQPLRSEEHTSELQSLMRISYAVFCLKKKTTTPTHIDMSICKRNSNKTKHDIAT